MIEQDQPQRELPAATAARPAVVIPTTARPPDRSDGAGRPRTSGRSRRHRQVMFAFVLPALVAYTALVIVPSLQTFELSLTNWDGVNAVYRYIGVENYREILSSGRFWNATRNTLLLGLGSAIIVNAIALGVAMLLDRLRHGSGFFRTIVYLPGLVSGFIAATIWKYLLNFNFGAVNTTLRDVGLDGLVTDWLGDNEVVVWMLLFILCFTLGANTTLIYLANLQSVPQELVEAARIDGANGRKVFRFVTWPMLAGAVTVNMTLGIIAGWQIFDQVMVLTAGGPGFVSETMAFFIYKVGFGEYRAGFGSAAAVVLFVIVMATTVVSNGYLRRREIQV